MSAKAPTPDESTTDAIAARYAANLAAVITETKPSPSELEQLLQTELRRMLDEEISHWFGLRMRTPHPWLHDLEVKS